MLDGNDLERWLKWLFRFAAVGAVASILVSLGLGAAIIWICVHFLQKAW